MSETVYTILLILVEVLFLFFTLRSLRGADMSPRGVSALGVGFILWLGLAVTLLSQNFFSATAVPQLSFGIVVAIPIVLGLLARRFWRSFGTAVNVISTETFLSLQQMRFPFGVMFFLTDGLPLWFQLIGGLGDMAAGIGAFVALRRLRKNRDRVNRAITEGNLMGILDFAVVFTLAFLVVIPRQPTALDDMFNLIPVVVVPVFILLHIFSLQKLTRSQQIATT